jgi:hypothetical protein
MICLPPTALKHMQVSQHLVSRSLHDRICSVSIKANSYMANLQVNYTFPRAYKDQKIAY